MCEKTLQPARIQERILSEFFSAPILGNTERGIYCEAMIAEQLGQPARITSHGWYPWDIQIGDNRADWPERIRIQIKNSARLQTWHGPGQQSDCSFRLNFRRLPEYFHRDNPDIPCEDLGFLSDLFLLCHHPETDSAKADHRDPGQWQVHVLSARRDGGHVTSGEFAGLHTQALLRGQSALIRKPETLGRGIRGRRPAPPVRLTELTLGMLLQ